MLGGFNIAGGIEVVGNYGERERERERERVCVCERERDRTRNRKYIMILATTFFVSQLYSTLRKFMIQSIDHVCNNIYVASTLSLFHSFRR